MSKILKRENGVSVLDQLSGFYCESRDVRNQYNIFELEVIGDEFVELTEQCDGYYRVMLTKEHLGELILELTEIHGKLR